MTERVFNVSFDIVVPEESDKFLTSADLQVTIEDILTAELPKECEIINLDTISMPYDNAKPCVTLELEDAKFLLSLMPPWALEVPPLSDPTMYGTGTQEGDEEVRKRVEIIRKKVEVLDEL